MGKKSVKPEASVRVYDTHTHTHTHTHSTSSPLIIPDVFLLRIMYHKFLGLHNLILHDCGKHWADFPRPGQSVG